MIEPVFRICLFLFLTKNGNQIKRKKRNSEELNTIALDPLKITNLIVIFNEMIVIIKK